MKRKVLLGILVLCLVLVGVLVFTACSEEDTPVEDTTGEDTAGEDTADGGGNPQILYTLSGDGTYYMVSGIDGTKATNVVIPSTYNSLPVTSIGRLAFSSRTSLTSITIPDSVTSIGTYAFRDCTSLTSITIPDSVTSIGSYAFMGCSGLTSITIGKSVASIGEQAFCGCTSLESITVSEENTVYYSQGNCIIETATQKLFAGCKNSVIPIDGSVTSIGSYAFYKCTSLTSITIPDSVTSIGSYSFAGCSGLTSVTIGNGVTSIGKYAFDDCTSLASITFNVTIDEWYYAIAKVSDWDRNTGNYTIHCTDGDIAKS